MSRFKWAVLWATLAGILLLTALSIYGAFLGAERAQEFFTSVPLAVYWFASIVLLAVGIAIFRRLLRVPGLLLMHLGCILVLLGAMWGSQAGHALQSRLFGIDRIPMGRMGLYPGMEDRRVYIADVNEVRELPFAVRLNDFRIEYYDPGQLIIWSQDERNWRMPAREGQTLSLSGDLGAVTIRRVFRNFRIDIQGEQRVAYDAPGGSRPALEVEIERPGLLPDRRFVFEQWGGHRHPDDPLAMSYHRSVKHYISDLEVVRDGQVVAAKSIEVNHPLYHGGYHFYQHQWGQDQFGQYSILLVVASSGLNVVYAGYIMLVGGILWHLWGRRIVKRFKTRPAIATDAPVQSE